MPSQYLQPNMFTRLANLEADTFVYTKTLLCRLNCRITATNIKEFVEDKLYTPLLSNYRFSLRNQRVALNKI